MSNLRDYGLGGPIDYPGYGGPDGSCFAAFVTNGWTTPIDVKVEYDGLVKNAATFAYTVSGSIMNYIDNLKYDPLPSGKIPVGSTAIVFLAEYLPEFRARA